MNNKDNIAFGKIVLVIIGLFVLIGGLCSAMEPEHMCAYYNCDITVAEEGDYCYLHNHSRSSGGYKKKTGSSTSSKYNSTSSGSTTNSSSNKTSSSTGNKTSNSSSKKKYNSGNSYDAGYDDVYMADDYDWDRYLEDDDYANGVDDALEDMDDGDW